MMRVCSFSSSSTSISSIIWYFFSSASALFISVREDRLFASRNSPTFPFSSPKVVTMFTLEDTAAICSS